MDGERLPRSAVRVTASGHLKRFSSRQDVLAVLELGLGAPVEVLNARWGSAFQEWIQQGATGCRFAQQRARHDQDTEWQTVLLDLPLDQARVTEVQSILENPGMAEAVQLVFPAIETLEATAEVIAALASSPYWEMHEIENLVDADSFALLALRWKVPGTDMLSEALAFGPFEEFPVTRQAPVVVLTLRTAAPEADEDNGRVHLAQMPLHPIEVKRKDWYMEATARDRADLLRDRLVHAARARVTCRLPRALWSAFYRDEDDAHSGQREVHDR